MSVCVLLLDTFVLIIGCRYSWKGKDHKVTSSASRFSRFAEKAGKFEVKSVALRGDQVGLLQKGSDVRLKADVRNIQCKRQVEGMVRTVHDLPSAKITSGENDLREGECTSSYISSFVQLKCVIRG